ncbi:putative baseplate assembly protein [Ruegeria hyattellae]|uniref:putative baseplate assembly protein n=1 Tax=Ruegeria hyattellae TaxID=3233337 RepID=UPI00355BA02C
MSSERYTCARPQRLQILREQGAINGLDFLEIADPAQTQLRVVFAHPLPGEPGEVPAAGTPIDETNIVVLGGERIRGIRVESMAVAGNEALITVNNAGDFSPYRLRLVADATLPDGPPPAGFDPWLAEIAFSFKVECPSDFDCALEAACEEAELKEPVLNYLAKDYESFRRLILDRMALQVPDWQDRSAADMQIALIEILAFLGDQLSQYQDAVTPETYLMTSRLRRSVSRHARLLDYRLGQGLNARSYAHVAVTAFSAADGAVLPAGTRLLTKTETTQTTIAPAELDTALGQGPVVFETMAELTMAEPRNAIAIHTWSDDICCLPRGATCLWIADTPAHGLAPGDLLLLEEIASPETGLPQDADPERRHVVRLTDLIAMRDDLEGIDVTEVHWDAADALPFSLCVSAEVLDQNGTPQILPTSLVRGNIVAVDDGLTLAGQTLDPPTRLDARLYEPRLPKVPVVFREGYDASAALDQPAAQLFQRTAAAALPAVTLSDGVEDWHARADLLRSRRFDAHFVGEPERNGQVYLRFGNHRFGKEPAIGTMLVATLRTGGGSGGNIGRDTLAHIVTDLDGIETVRNPVPGQGGARPESLSIARTFAPQAYRTQRRAVIAEDYARVAEEDPDVQRAVAEHMWFGSWYTVVITIDGRDGRLISEDAAFRTGLLDLLDARRMAGVDLQLRDPIFLNLDLAVRACAEPGRFASDVRAALIDRFTAGRQANGQKGFFHPDNLTFGQVLFPSEILAAAMEVDGVQSAEISHLRRWGQPGANLMTQGSITPGAAEVFRLENNPSLPENGVFACDVEGGL